MESLKGLFPGCENMWWTNCFFLPAEGKQNATFSPDFKHSCMFLILHTVPQRPEKMEDPHRHAGGVGGGDGDDDSRGGRVKHSSVV